MMATHRTAEEQELKASLAPIIRVLRSLGGHFTFTDEDGEQFVIARRLDFESIAQQAERQLALPQRETQGEQMKQKEEVSHEADEADITEHINRDIAFANLQEQEEPVDDIALEDPREEYAPPSPPPVRVRFEPIKGDLPPELQE